MAERHTRFQGAIVRDHRILLLYGRTSWNGEPREFWLLPGGGREPGETPKETVRREMLEETRLEVRVERLIMSEEPHPADDGPYRQVKTCLCISAVGEAGPGIEPEVSSAEWAILDVSWLDLRDETDWGAELLDDPITYDQFGTDSESSGLL